MAAYRILTRRLTLRCYELGDAPQVKAAVDRNREHLAEMPWIRFEPQTLDEKLQLLRRFRGEFDLDQDYTYGIFLGDQYIGGTGLHTRVGPNAREIGYWIAREHAGQGLATEAAAALTRVGFEVDGVARIEIHCAPWNRASARVAEKLGYTHEATLRGRATDAAGAPRDAMIWTRFSTLEAPLEAFDGLGRKLL